MATGMFNRDEEEIRSAIINGEYDNAKKLLTEKGDKIRRIHRSLFQAYIAFAAEDEEQAWKAIAEGLEEDGRNYELYYMLGDYYAARNLQQAYLCYENALFYCDVPEDREQISLALENLRQQGISVPKAAIVILSYNLIGMTRDCIESIRKTTPASAREIVVVDNASSDGSVEWLKEQTDIKLQCNAENAGFPRGCNQGIWLAEKESDIFLLNNDTILPDNALFWLRMGLYESEEIGSAGSVTNHAPNFQTIIEGGKSEEEYLNFAKGINIPMRKAYQNKLILIGFALLLKRTVLEQIGILDERFSPGNYEDNDICLRIILAGYRNVLCKNSFIIHWGHQSFRKEPQKFNSVLQENQEKFFKKWSMIRLYPDAYWNARFELISFLNRSHTVTDEKIMVVGTMFGQILSNLQGQYPDAEIYGMEQEQYMAQIADRIADTVWVDFDAWNGDELKDTFDSIIINDSLDRAKNPQKFLHELVKMLKPDGQIVVSMLNGTHYSRIEQQQESSGLFSKKQARKIFFEEKMAVNEWGYTKALNVVVDDKIARLQEQFPDLERDELEAYQWIVVLDKQRNDVQFHQKMVVCIPTCSHPEVVNEVLDNCAETYHRYGLDVYYYDSSEDEKTKRVIESYQAKGFDNLHYIAVDPEMPVFTKFEHVLMMEGISKEYEYMWYLRDRCWCEEKTLRLMHKAIGEHPDLIFLDVGHPDCVQELSVCRDANEFYHRCGDYATSVDTTIYNVKSMLWDEAGVEEFRKKYDENFRCSFVHYLLIFDHLSKKNNPNILLLAGKKVGILHSQKGHSGWGSNRINIWLHRWIRANNALPSCYKNKDEVVKRTASLPWILGHGSETALIALHNSGMLTPEVYEEIKESWSLVSDIPVEILKRIANGQYEEYYNPLQLKQNASKNINAISQLYEMLLKDQLSPTEVPLVQITAVTKQLINACNVCDKIEKGMINEALDNVNMLANEKLYDKPQMLMMLQTMMGILILAEKLA